MYVDLVTFMIITPLDAKIVEFICVFKFSDFCGRFRVFLFIIWLPVQKIKTHCESVKKSALGTQLSFTDGKIYLIPYRHEMNTKFSSTFYKI